MKDAIELKYGKWSIKCFWSLSQEILACASIFIFFSKKIDFFASFANHQSPPLNDDYIIKM